MHCSVCLCKRNRGTNRMRNAVTSKIVIQTQERILNSGVCDDTDWRRLIAFWNRAPFWQQTFWKFVYRGDCLIMPVMGYQHNRLKTRHFLTKNFIIYELNQSHLSHFALKVKINLIFSCRVALRWLDHLSIKHLYTIFHYTSTANTHVQELHVLVHLSQIKQYIKNMCLSSH